MTATTGLGAIAATPASADTVVARVSTNKAAVRDAAGQSWSADTGFSGGYNVSPVTSSPIAGTTDDVLYQSEHYGMSAFRAPVPATGTYKVTLKMAENYFSGPRQRVFDVAAEGQKVLSDVDIFARAGKNSAYDTSFTIPVTDGRLDLSFTHKANYGKVSAIEITRVDGNATTSPAPAPAPQPGISVQSIKVTTSGDKAVATATVDGRGLQVDDLAIAVRSRVNPVDNGNLDFAHYGRIPVGSQTLTRSRTLPAGDYAAHIAYSVGGKWTHASERFPFTVGAGTQTPAPTPTPTPTPAPAPLPSGSWLSGASGVGVASGQFGTWRGRPVDIAATWADNNSAMVGLGQFDPGKEYGSWQQSIDVSIGAIGPGESWGAAAGGAYDGRWRQSLTNLKSKWGSRPGTVYIRFAHEMNGNWYPWSVNAGNHQSFIQSWKRFRALQKEIFPQSKLVFNVNRESVNNGIDWRKTFPGNAYVDVMGVDYYNQYPYVDTTAEWQQSLTHTDGYGAPKGLQRHLEFARSVGLPLAISEWSGNADNGDSPVFMQEMYNFFRTHGGPGAGNLLYEIQFNVDRDGQRWLLYPSSRMSKSSEMYRNLW